MVQPNLKAALPISCLICFCKSYTFLFTFICSSNSFCTHTHTHTHIWVHNLPSLSSYSSLTRSHKSKSLGTGITRVVKKLGSGYSLPTWQCQTSKRKLWFLVGSVSIHFHFCFQLWFLRDPNVGNSCVTECRSQKIPLHNFRHFQYSQEHDDGIKWLPMYDFLLVSYSDFRSR